MALDDNSNSMMSKLEIIKMRFFSFSLIYCIHLQNVLLNFPLMFLIINISKCICVCVTSFIFRENQTCNKKRAKSHVQNITLTENDFLEN